MHQSQAMLSASSLHTRERMYTTDVAKPQSMISEETPISLSRCRESVHTATRELSSERKLENISFDLKMEAETLNKWKLSTEFRLQQAEKKSSQLVQMTKTQRQTILDLQLNNDSMCARLQEEARYKEELYQKHETTGALCQIVKLQTDEIFQQLQNFEAISKEIATQNACHKDTIDELTAKFKILTHKSESVREDLNNKLACVENDFRTKEEGLLQKLLNADNEKRNLQRLQTEQTKAIEQHKENYIIMEEKLNILTSEKMLNSNQLAEKQLLLEQHWATIDQMKKETVTLSEEIANLKGEKEYLDKQVIEHKSLLQECNDVNNVLRSTEERLSEEISKGKREQEELQQALTEKEMILQECNATIDQLKQHERNLLEEITKLKHENTDLTAQLHDKEVLHQEFVNALDKLKGRENDLLNEITQLRDEKDGLLQEMKYERDTFDEERKKQQEMFIILREEKETELLLKTKEISTQLKEVDEWKMQCKEAEEREEGLRMKNDELVLELNNMRDQLENLSTTKGEIINKSDVLRQENTDLQMQLNKCMEKLQEVQIEAQGTRQCLQNETREHQTTNAAFGSLSETHQNSLADIAELKVQIEKQAKELKILFSANEELKSAVEEALVEKNHTIKDYDILLNTRKTDKAHFEEKLNEKQQWLEDNAAKLVQLEKQLQSVLSETKQKDAELDGLRAEASHASKENGDKIRSLQRQLEQLAQSKDDEIKSWELRLHVANRTKEVELQALETDNLYNQQVQNQKTQEVLHQKEQKIKSLQEDVESLCKEIKSFKAAEVKMKCQQAEQDNEISSFKEKIQDLLQTKNSEIATLRNDLETLKHNKEEEIKLLQHQRKTLQETLQLQVDELKADKEDLVREKQRWLDQLEEQMQQLRPQPVRQAPHLPPSPNPPGEQVQVKPSGQKSAFPRMSNSTPRQSVLQKTPKPIVISEDEKDDWNRIFSSSPSDENENMYNDHDMETQREISRMIIPEDEDVVPRLQMNDDQTRLDEEISSPQYRKETPNRKKKLSSKSPAIPKTRNSNNRTLRSEVKVVKQSGRRRKLSPECSEHTRNSTSEQTGRTRKSTPEQSERTQKSIPEQTGRIRKSTPEQSERTRKSTPEQTGRIRKSTPEQSERARKSTPEQSGRTRNSTPDPKLPAPRSSRVSTSSSKVSVSLVENSVTTSHPLSKSTPKLQATSPAGNFNSLHAQEYTIHSDSSEGIEGDLLQRQLKSAGLQVHLSNKSPRTPRYNMFTSPPQSKKKKAADFESEKKTPTVKPKPNVRRADIWYRGERKFFRSQPVVNVDEQSDSSRDTNASDIFKFPED